MRFPAVVTALLAGLSLAWPTEPLPALQQEQILQYWVQMHVRPGGVLHVREDIDVLVQGRQIRRGIYRDFPTTLPGRGAAGRRVAPFEVLSVHRNGAPEPYRLEPIYGEGGRGGVRVRIGRSDVEIPHQVHRYTIVYETARWVEFGEDRVRLDWNVTGNGWAFPIQSAVAVIDLPGAPPAEAIELDAWTGPQGSGRKDAEWAYDPETGMSRFEITRPLGLREGLTVRVDFPSGIVPPPTEAQRAEWEEVDWSGWREAATLVGLLLTLYLLGWVTVGIDPRGGTVVVRYEPPAGFSPAGLGYLWDRGFLDRQLTATLVDFGVKGLVEIEKEGRFSWTIRRTGEGAAKSAELEPEERRLYQDLLGDRTELTLTGGSNEDFRKTVVAFNTALSDRFRKTYFHHNLGWTGAGFLLSLGGLGWLAWTAEPGPSVPGFIASLGTFLTVLFIAGLASAVVLRRVPAKELLGCLGSLAVACGLIYFSGMGQDLAWEFRAFVPVYLPLTATVLAVATVAFYHLVQAPTRLGREVLDELEGFERFLTATEGDRLDRLQEPGGSLELFERYLPHAIALGIENRWAERFEDALTPAAARAGAATDATTLAWFSGAGSGSLSSMTSSLGGSFSSSISSSSSSPSGGSGGGGGSSGGGGGGGGW